LLTYLKPTQVNSRWGQCELTHVGCQCELTHVGYQRELSHGGFVERELKFSAT